MPQSIHLIRHGETEWSRTGRHTGRTDVALTAAGEASAQAVAALLHGREFPSVLVSPLVRARETCRIVGYGAVAEVEANLREWDYGDYEGRTTAEIQLGQPGWSIWSGPVPNGESLDSVAARARVVLERARKAGGDVALFGHGHMLRILAACWVGFAPSAASRLTLDTGSVSVLGYERETPAIRLWNFSAAPL